MESEEERWRVRLLLSKPLCVCLGVPWCGKGCGYLSAVVPMRRKRRGRRRMVLRKIRTTSPSQSSVHYYSFQLERLGSTVNVPQINTKDIINPANSRTIFIFYISEITDCPPFFRVKHSVQKL